MKFIYILFTLTLAACTSKQKENTKELVDDIGDVFKEIGDVIDEAEDVVEDVKKIVTNKEKDGKS